jgi:hypothetical protein
LYNRITKALQKIPSPETHTSSHIIALCLNLNKQNDGANCSNNFITANSNDNVCTINKTFYRNGTTSDKTWVDMAQVSAKFKVASWRDRGSR